MKTIITFATLTIVTFFAIDVIAEHSHEENKLPPSKRVELAHPKYEEVFVWSEGQNSQSSGYSSPTSLLTQADMISINVATTEDLVKFEPSIVIRRRFIGDSNGTLGIRGANMFQTPRSMVFADGVPLHYFLESRWKGAPRWTMVSASEIAQVEVVYGPFSAEYSGNTMGGAVLIETAIPQEQELHIDGSFFRQQFSDYGFNDDSLDGHKGFISYGNKIENFSFYLSFNHLDNDSQPQTFRYGSPPTPTTSPTIPIPVTGAIFENDSRGHSQPWYGDTGIVKTKTDNYKIKLGYEFNNWASLLNIAYEDRTSKTDSANIYLSPTGENADNELIWSSPVIQDGQIFAVDSSRLNDGKLSRESLSIGLRLRGEISDSITLETNFNQFKVLKDENRKSRQSLDDPSYNQSGSIADYKNSGWKTADLKLTFEDIFTEDLEFITGIRHERYSLNLDLYDSPNYKTGEKGLFISRFGGNTSLAGAFAQFNWGFSKYIDIAFGVRREQFKSSDGYFDDDDAATPTHYELAYIPSESKSKTSPKFSLGLKPAEHWLVRYSLAKAYRFPIAEELFSQYEDFNSSSIARPDLKPEDGIFQNVMIERTLEDGYLRTNIFIDNVQNAIESQLYRNVDANDEDVRTFSPIDRVKTLGIEFIFNKYNVIIDNFDLRFNLSYTDAEIVENKLNADTEGNQAPRQPKWRSHLLSTYHLNEDWSVSGNFQYASDSYGRITNDDNEDNVYGAQDGYTRIGLNTRYKLNEHLAFGLGIDNITNEITYVAHPWPSRTLYVNVSYDM